VDCINIKHKSIIQIICNNMHTHKESLPMGAREQEWELGINSNKSRKEEG
jgi:hypothetical protein